jgi:hypothetical protein
MATARVELPLRGLVLAEEPEDDAQVSVAVRDVGVLRAVFRLPCGEGSLHQRACRRVLAQAAVDAADGVEQLRLQLWLVRQLVGALHAAGEQLAPRDVGALGVVRVVALEQSAP